MQPTKDQSSSTTLARFGYVAAIALMGAQSVIALYKAWHATPIRIGFSDLFFTVPTWPPAEALSQERTLGYPVFLNAIELMGGPDLIPFVQMLIIVVCTLVFWRSLQIFGYSPIASACAASPLLWVINYASVMPVTLALAFTIAAIGAILWIGARPDRPWPYLALAVSTALTYQMRPAFLFMIVYVPLVWAIVYVRRNGWNPVRSFARRATYVVGATVLPLVLFSLLRLAIVDHFGLVSFGGQNTIGISIEMLNSRVVAKLPPDERPYAQVLSQARAAWPLQRVILNGRAATRDPKVVSSAYIANVNRIGRALDRKFPVSGDRDSKVESDSRMGSMSVNVFRADFKTYVAWVTNEFIQAIRVFIDFALIKGFGIGTWAAFSIAGLLVLLIVLRALSPPYSAEHHSGLGLSLAEAMAYFFAFLFILKMTLVVLVEPAIPRYVEPAVFLFPSLVLAFSGQLFAEISARTTGRSRLSVGFYTTRIDGGRSTADEERGPLRWKPMLAGALVVTFVAALGIAFYIRSNDEPRIIASMKADDADPLVIASMIESTPSLLDVRDRNGATLLHYAALNNWPDFASFLTSNKKDLIHATTSAGSTPLHWAAIQGSPRAARVLIDRGADPATPGPLGLSPLHLAALMGKEPMVQLLLQAGCNPNIRSNYAITPLHLTGSRYVANTLLGGGANVSARDRSKSTALHWAPDQEFIRFLVRRGADVDAQDNWGYHVRSGTRLHKAAYQKDDMMARYLLQLGADPNVGDASGMTPLFYAIWRADIRMVHLLLDHDADINHPAEWVPDDSDWRFSEIIHKTLGEHKDRFDIRKLEMADAMITPIGWAAFLGNSYMVVTLADRGATLNARDDHGLTPLHWAIIGDQPKTVSALLWRAGKFSPFDDESHTAQTLIAGLGRDRLLPLLRRYGAGAQQ